MIDYNWDMEQDQIMGFVSDQQEIRQWVQRVLLTERNLFPQYSDQYGIEYRPYQGSYPSIVLVHLKDSIEQALTIRSEIQGISNFDYQTDRSRPGVLQISFMVNTIYGSFPQSMEVRS